ncbi:hypothetical protein C8R43DRAFT_58587 [Mycena crocata]|nr:hypothetical protein C8R43DRAFT_58587 [Mycena crocata]
MHHIRPALRSPRRPFCRTLASYSPKVRAFPFKISPEEAIKDLSDHIVHGPTAVGPTFEDGIPARMNAAFGDTPIRPEKIVPIYFPAWFIDAEVHANSTTTTPLGTEDGQLRVICLNSYLPGHNWDKLSSISLLSPNLNVDESVSFSSDLEIQYDTKIICLPFTTTPFSIPRGLRSLQPDQCKITENLLFDPLSVDVKLFCAYPVLMPLYLAQYAVDVDANKNYMYKTAFIEAHSDEGRIVVENIREITRLSRRAERTGSVGKLLIAIAKYFDQQLDDLDRKLEESQSMSEQRGLLYHRGDRSPFGNFDRVMAIHHGSAWGFDMPRGLTRWVDGHVTTEALQLLKADDQKMGDPRIRPFTGPEVGAVRKYFTLSVATTEADALLHNLSQIKPAAEVNPGNDVQDYLASKTAQREAALPDWWRHWQKSQAKTSNKKH